ncbi:MAG: hypothetical protein JXQ87_02565 [Bacteroidia bacterium]
MMFLRCFLFLLLSFQLSAQINKDSLTIEGITNYSKSFKIRRVFGTPNDTFQLDYDCGFLSSQWQGEKFWCLQYEGVRFAGNQKFGYVIEKIDSTHIDSFEIDFYNIPLGTEIDENDLNKILFNCFKRYYVILPGEGTIIGFKNADDGVIFLFKNKKLVGVEYFSPC